MELHSQHNANRQQAQDKPELTEEEQRVQRTFANSIPIIERDPPADVSITPHHRKR